MGASSVLLGRVPLVQCRCLLSSVGDTTSTVENVQNCKRCSVLWRMFRTVGDFIITVGKGYHQYIERFSLLWRMLSTVGDIINTLENC